MIRISLLAVLIVTSLFKLGCKQDETTEPVQNYSPIGEWRQIIKFEDKTYITDVNFKEDNTFEMKEYFGDVIGEEPDFFNSIGEYEIINNYLLYIQVYESWFGEERIEPFQLDTTIYRFTENNLHLSFMTSHFVQLDGQSNQLVDGTFYSSIYDKHMKLYDHWQYEFSKDSLDLLYHRIPSNTYPSDWDISIKMRYTTNENDLIMSNNQNESDWRMGYIFIAGKLYIGNAIESFSRF